eukprot:4673253-Ditylum_brightwellii.AAC.1
MESPNGGKARRPKGKRSVDNTCHEQPTLAAWPSNVGTSNKTPNPYMGTSTTLQDADLKRSRQHAEAC